MKISNPFATPVPQTTEGAIAHFSKGVDMLRNVYDLQIDSVAHYREESELATALANKAEQDAEHAARIIQRFTEFVS